MTSRSRLAEAKIYTMRQLNHDTSGVLGEIAEEQRPAFITRMGRFVARISPVSPSALEVQALTELLSSTDAAEQYTDDRSADELRSSEELLAAVRREDFAPAGAEQRGAGQDQVNAPESLKLYTMRELSHRTAAVIREINELDQSAVVTKRGRFLAVISPLASMRLEEVALTAVFDSVDAASYTSVEPPSGSISSAEAASRLGVHWRAR